MSLHLLTAPAGAGKTQHVLDQIQAHCAAKPLPRVLVILPSRAQDRALRERLGKLARPVFGVTLINFYDLYHSILDTTAALPRRMPEAARYRVTRALLRMLVDTNSLSYFAPIASKPGFITAVSGFIADLKQGRVQPEHFAALAATPRVTDLAQIYSAYQNFLLTHNLADREGIGWLALTALENDASLFANYDYVAADGFDEFNPTQLELLRLLAARTETLDVTLTYQPDRRAHARFADTFAQLNASATSLAPLAPSRVAPLTHLEQYLFEPAPPQTDVADALTLTAAPDRLREVRTIARHAKQLLVQGIPPAHIGIHFRTLSPYTEIVRQVFGEFGIPYRVQEGISLASNPLVAALLNLATCSVNEFLWRETFDALHSPYFTFPGLDSTAKSHIERIVRESIVVRGRGAWLDAFVKPTASLDQDKFRKRLVDELNDLEIAALRAQLESFFNRVTPEPRAPVAVYVSFLQSLLGSDADQNEPDPEATAETVVSADPGLQVIAHVRTGDAELTARDLAALESLNEVLRGILQASELLGETEIAWRDFVADLTDAVNIATYDLHPALDGRILISSVTQARGVPKPYVFLGGLFESEFPQRAPQDPLLTTADRAALNDAGVPLADFMARDETTLFYEAATLARQQLALSYPRFDDSGNSLYPSPFVGLVQQLFTNLTPHIMSVDDVPAPATAASYTELAVALALLPNAPHARGIAQSLALVSAAWRHSRTARAIELCRESLDACDVYSGVMSDAAILANCSHDFDTTYGWSATQLNEWGACGFRFFARRVLRLQEWVEPVEGMEAHQLGAVYHKILQTSFDAYAAQNLIITPETFDTARAILEQCTQRVLDDAPRRFAFRATAWWEQERQEIARRLLQFLRSEAERNVDTPTLPFKTEQPFDVNIDLGGANLHLKGTIDRMDKVGDEIVLMDYKTGTTKISKQDVREGRHLQLPVYLLAAEQMGYRVADAFFAHIGDGKLSRALPPEERTAILDAALVHIERYVNMARRGEFAVKPARIHDGACTAYCEFSALCRVGRWSARKGQPHASR